MCVCARLRKEGVGVLALGVLREVIRIAREPILRRPRHVIHPRCRTVSVVTVDICSAVVAVDA